MDRRLRGGLSATVLGLAVGLVLADSSIVILALPDVLAQFRPSIDDVAWVITAFNLVLALTAVPAAYLSRRVPPGPVCAAGLAVFGLASLACALAGDLGPLIGARCVQAVGGAFAVCSALELLPAVVGTEARAATVWATAGAIGSALGPALGGVLTEAFDWRAVFGFQVPVALVLAVLVARSPASARRLAAPGRPNVGANVALALVSAALVAALFLIVLLLIQAWRMSPIQAAATVSVLPLASLLALRLPDPKAPPWMTEMAGIVLVAGGLAALGVLPHGSWPWTLAPQVLIGFGLAITLSALTARALRGRSPQAIHGGWTIASRHAGVVVGLLLLTPIFTADLESAQTRATEAGTAVVLESPLPIQLKLRLGGALESELSNRAEVPDLRPAFRSVQPSPEQRPAYRQLEEDLLEQVRRAATHAFSRAFLIASGLAVLALLPVALRRSEAAL
jgi:MFS family permease